ncbi:MAG: hypothetical protein NVSMB25_08500 [Thermoleophilaceae bacterium]
MERIEAAGGLVVTVVCDEPARVRAGLLRGVEVAHPVVVDIDRSTYRSWGLRRASRTSFVTRPGWIADYALAAVRTADRPRRPGHDVRQLGGDFVIAPSGRVALSRPQAGFDDRPPAGELVQALERAAREGSVL